MNRVMTVQERHSVGILHVTPVIQATRRYARTKRKNEHQDEGTTIKTGENFECCDQSPWPEQHLHEIRIETHRWALKDIPALTHPVFLLQSLFFPELILL